MEALVLLLRHRSRNRSPTYHPPHPKVPWKLGNGNWELGMDSVEIGDTHVS